MTTMKQLGRLIAKRRRKRVSDRKIAKELGVANPEINRLAAGIYPGPKIAAVLGLPPICYVCDRKMPVVKKEHKPRAVVLNDSQVNMKQHINRVIVSEWHDLDTPDIRKVLLSIVKDLKN